MLQILCYVHCIILYIICEQIISLYWLTIFKDDLCFASTLVGMYSVGAMYIQYVLQSILTPLPSKLPLTYTTSASSDYVCIYVPMIRKYILTFNRVCTY